MLSKCREEKKGAKKKKTKKKFIWIFNLSLSFFQLFVPFFN